MWSDGDDFRSDTQRIRFVDNNIDVERIGRLYVENLSSQH